MVVSICGGSRDLPFYQSGVWTPTKEYCTVSNHAVTAVGWKSIKRNEEYIIVRNSWGASWGEEGHIRVAYKPTIKDSCFVTSDAFLPIINK